MPTHKNIPIAAVKMYLVKFMDDPIKIVFLRDSMKLSPSIKNFLLSPYLHLTVLLVICAVATLQAIAQDEIANFIIFKTAGERFVSQKNVYDYIQYGIIWDKYLYSPAFSLLFLPLTWLPLGVSIFLWLAVSAFLFYFAIQKLPLTKLQVGLLFWISLLDLVNSLQNLQTNAINAAFMLLIPISLKDGRPALAALFTALCLSIKIYPAGTALLFLFFPKKIHFMAYTLFFLAAIFLLPFLFVPGPYYASTLEGWYATLSKDTNPLSNWESQSLIGINYTWFPRTLNHFYIQLAGLLLVFLPLVKGIRSVQNDFLLKYISLIMIFVVIFNHTAESPTYIIATAGAALWYAVSERTSTHHMLLVLLFMGCILLPTDIFPHWLRKEYFVPMKIRVIPVFLIWLHILFDLLTYRRSAHQTV